MSLLPDFDPSEIRHILHEHFHLERADCSLLTSERDQNFLVSTQQGRFVLKVFNAGEDLAFLEAQGAMLATLRGAGVDSCPSIVPDRNGEPVSFIKKSGRQFAAWLVTCIEGPLLDSLKYLSPELLADWGRCMGRIDAALQGFDHPALHREFHWDLARAESVVESGLTQIDEQETRGQISRLLENFRRDTRPWLDDLPRSAIHNDANDANVVIGWSADALSPDQVRGVFDFGDSVYSWTVADLAVAVAYAWLKTSDLLDSARRVAQGYHEVRPLSEAEASAVYGLACMRLCVSAVIAARQHRDNPANDYLIVSQSAIASTLPRLLEIPFGLAVAATRSTCGWEAVRNHSRILRWIDGQSANASFPVNPRHPGRRPEADEILVMNLGVESPLLRGAPSELDEPRLTAIIDGEIQRAGATIGVGRYLEPRFLYSSEQFGGGGNSSPLARELEERRTIHLGIDLFAAAGATVVAALSGTVAIATRIERPLDYGGLVIVRHETDAGDSFCLLYGHLDPESIKELMPGQEIAAGQEIGRLGSATVNGGWTPHLHFQVILDLVGLAHEFPGVCRASQVDIWRDLSPDPNRILGIPRESFPPEPTRYEETLSRRRARIGRGLSLSYRRPLKLVRGWRQFLYDESGRRFLDAFNNVPHVGHCHPAIVDAVHRQMSLLNSNTRYLHDLPHELARRIAATMPAPLEVCYFLNSASEANELALRLAEAHTGHRDLIVLKGAYHGNTRSLIDASPWKHAGPGGSGRPAHVHAVAVPDTFRGSFRDPATAGRKYAEEVRARIEDFSAGGRGLSAFIAESCPSVAGQIIPPANWLSSVYSIVREAGGVCIADEVQTAYGRLGEVFHGFELDQAVPDIVVLGKPIGNGHPLAAVVTTQEISASFDSGMEFFSTFGGNPVSCAAGLAVLDVLRDEGLQENARRNGSAMLDGLKQLRDSQAVIGDVRGKGFFIGVELTQRGQSVIPAPRAASFVVNRMRDRGVLIGSDGIDGNVLKIRPPMCFAEVDCATLVEILGESLREWQGMSGIECAEH